MLVIGNKIIYSVAQFRAGPGFGGQKTAKRDLVGAQTRGTQYRSCSSAENISGEEERESVLN